VCEHVSSMIDSPGTERVSGMLGRL
jgi:hypothetical protein